MFITRLDLVILQIKANAKKSFKQGLLHFQAGSSYPLRSIRDMHNLNSFATTTLGATDGILVDDVENLLVNIVAAAKFGNWQYLK